ncbi:MAG: hypothetical protein HYY24_06830 [Verrucomicrobia bacterium]|nr:hypothetical protein [Verrucomicrobiota bacterium]
MQSVVFTAPKLIAVCLAFAGTERDAGGAKFFGLVLPGGFANLAPPG